MNIDIIGYCIDFKYSKMSKSRGYPPAEIELTRKQYAKLLCRPEYLGGLPKPQPPIKSKETRAIPAGFFLFHSHVNTKIEYDHHAPLYIEAVKKWEKDAKIFNELYPNGKIFGMKVLIVD